MKMELSSQQAQEINQRVRAYYLHLAEDLGIVNPPQDLDAFGAILVNSIHNLALGKVPIVNRRQIKHRPPKPIKWDPTTYTSRRVATYLKDLARAINIPEDSLREQNPDKLFNLIDEHIRHIRGLPNSTPSTTRISVPTVLRPSVRVTPVPTVPTVPTVRSVNRSLTSIPGTRATSPVRSPVRIPSLPTPVSSPRTQVRVPITPAVAGTALAMSRASSPSRLRMSRSHNNLDISALAERLAARSDEVAALIGVDEEELLETLKPYFA